MKDLEQILDLFEQKKIYFLHYEKEMENLPLLPAEEMESCLERGAVLIKRIEELEARLGPLIQQNGPLAISAANHDCDRRQLDPELGKIYDASLGAKSVANRIVENDGMIRQRIAYEREQALEKIKEINNSSASVAGRYSRYTQPGTIRIAPEWQGKEV